VHQTTQEIAGEKGVLWHPHAPDHVPFAAVVVAGVEEDSVLLLSEEGALDEPGEVRPELVDRPGVLRFTIQIQIQIHIQIQMNLWPSTTNELQRMGWRYY
jgi:hypothetical protein